MPRCYLPLRISRRACGRTPQLESGNYPPPGIMQLLRRSRANGSYVRALSTGGYENAVDPEGSRGAEHQLGIGSQNAHAMLDMSKPFRLNVTRMNRLILYHTIVRGVMKTARISRIIVGKIVSKSISHTQYFFRRESKMDIDISEFLAGIFDWQM